MGKITLGFEDAGRENRPVGISVWYPALLPEGSTGPKLLAGEKRDPDRSGAPYPLIVSSATMGMDLAPFLARRRGLHPRRQPRHRPPGTAAVLRWSAD